MRPVLAAVGLAALLWARPSRSVGAEPVRLPDGTEFPIYQPRHASPLSG